MDDFETLSPRSHAPTPATPAKTVSARENLDTLVPVINHEARLFSVAEFLPIKVPEGHTLDEKTNRVRDQDGKIVNVERETATHKLHQGLNLVPLRIAQQVMKEGLSLYNGKIEVAQPWLSPDSYAVHIAEITVSKSALEHWRTQEQRPHVIKAIDARLKSGQAKAA